MNAYHETLHKCSNYYNGKLESSRKFCCGSALLGEYAVALGTVYALHIHSYTWKCAGITYYATCQYVWNFEYIDRYHCLIGSLQVKMENMDIVVTQLLHFPNDCTSIRPPGARPQRLMSQLSTKQHHSVASSAWSNPPI